MDKASVLYLVLGLIVAAVVSALVVTLLPAAGAGSYYIYETNENGIIRWFRKSPKQEILTIKSSLLEKTYGVAQSDEENLECGQARFDIQEIFQTSGSNDKCWSVSSARGGADDCSSEYKFPVKDCLYMHTKSNEPVYWFGGAEMVSQKWPMNNVSLKRGAPFLSSDLPQRIGNVLERYFISSRGAALYVDPDVPLHVTVLPNDAICLEASYDDYWLVGPGYLSDRDNPQTSLFYTVCVGEDAKSVQQRMTDKDNGFIRRPSDLPDLKMLQYPIWSTWARYKDKINQTVVETFADEIRAHNFSYSQLEIDDGYEKEYGDFSFDSSKFPDARSMVNSLHKKGFRVTVWTTPFINPDSKNYAAAVAEKYFVPGSSDGTPTLIQWWRGQGIPVDFTNTGAVQWYQSILRNTQSAFGIDSFKFDAGETTYLPKSGLNYSAVHYTNPSVYTTQYANAAYEIGGKIMEMRSTWKTQNGSFFVRLMDKGSSWGALRGFRTVIPSALTFGILGYPFVLPDMIGGNVYFFGDEENKPERELYIRWIELSAFLPCMQFSISPWQYDEEVTEIAQRYVELHQTIIYDEVFAAATRYVAGDMSLPVSPLWFHSSFSEDPEAAFLSNDFVVGDKYLVAPILEKGSTQRDIYFPGGSEVKWRDKMRPECYDNDTEQNCIVEGGRWIYAYHVDLDQISWWEKLT